MIKNVRLWLVLAVFCCLLLAIVAANLPAATKKLGLFSFLLGGVVGYVLPRLPGYDSSKSAVLIIAGLILLGGITEAGRLAETFRQFQNYRQQQLQKELTRADGFAAILADQIDLTTDLDWQTFLQLRYASLPGFPPQPASGLLISLVIIEILLAMSGAGLACFRLKPAADSKTDTTSNPSDTSVSR